MPSLYYTGWVYAVPVLHRVGGGTHHTVREGHHHLAYDLASSSPPGYTSSRRGMTSHSPQSADRCRMTEPWALTFKRPWVELLLPPRILKICYISSVRILLASHLVLVIGQKDRMWWGQPCCFTCRRVTRCSSDVPVIHPIFMSRTSGIINSFITFCSKSR